VETNDPQDSSRPAVKKKRRVKRERRVDKNLSVRRLSDSVQLKPLADVEPTKKVSEKPPEPPSRRKVHPIEPPKAFTVVGTKTDSIPVRSTKPKPVSIPDVPPTYVSKTNLILSPPSEKTKPGTIVKDKTEKVLSISPEFDGADKLNSDCELLSSISERSEPSLPAPRKSLPYKKPDPAGPKGALTVLFEKGLEVIAKKSEENFPEGDVISENPFRSPSPPPVIHRRPHTLRVKVGFESSAIGQDIQTAPTEVNNSDKTLPYFLKTEQKTSIPKSPVKSERIESNIEYEKSIELGKNIIKVPEKDPPKTPELREVQYFVDETSPSPPVLRKSTAHLKIKVPKPDYSNEIREEVEPITPDTDQSEIEDILEQFSKEVKQSDIEDILSGDESRRSRTPKRYLETAFLSTPTMPESRSYTPTRSGRESAPIFKIYDRPPESGRQSVPVDHPQVLRTRSLSRDGHRNAQDLRLRMPASPTSKSEPRSPYSAGEIEAVFWDRLKQKKIRAALREQELLKSNGHSPSTFSRNSPHRSTIGPVFQSEYEAFPQVQMRTTNGRQVESPVPRSQSAMDFTKKKEEKGLMSKIPFFRKKSKNGKDDGAYKKAGEDVCDEPTPIFNRGSLLSNGSSSEGLENPLSPKKVSFDRSKSLENGRPLPPVPDTGYGVILRRKQTDVYGRAGEGGYGATRPANLPLRPASAQAKMFNSHVRASDTESGSEAGEVQRIMMRSGPTRMKSKFFLSYCGLVEG